MIEELKPCPFCGTDEPLRECGANHGLYYIECRDCPAVMEDDTEARVTNAWNTRTAYNPNERLREALEAVEGQLDEEELAMIAKRKSEYGSHFTSDQEACIKQMFRQRRAGVTTLVAALSHKE